MTLGRPGSKAESCSFTFSASSRGNTTEANGNFGERYENRDRQSGGSGPEMPESHSRAADGGGDRAFGHRALHGSGSPVAVRSRSGRGARARCGLSAESDGRDQVGVPGLRSAPLGAVSG